MDRTDIIIALSHHQDVQKDVDALVCRIAGIGKRNPMVDRLEIVIDTENRVIDFIKDLSEIRVGGGRGDLQKESESSDYLETFKKYEKLWASRKNEGTPKKDWYKMQDELAEYINDYSSG